MTDPDNMNVPRTWKLACAKFSGIACKLTQIIPLHRRIERIIQSILQRVIRALDWHRIRCIELLVKFVSIIVTFTPATLNL